MNFINKSELITQQSCGLYVINSGRDDSIYKIGITSNPEMRLTDIRIDYAVPDAYYLGFVELPSRDKALALETSLHSKYERQRCSTMNSWEWFSLSLEDVEDICTSNDLQRFNNP